MVVKDLNPEVGLWFRKGGKTLGGKGKVELLLAIEREGSLSRAAKKLGMSYRHAWGMVKELEGELGVELLRRRRGGKEGGESVLTEEGKKLVRWYGVLEEALREMVKEETFWEALSTRLSARNRLKGIIESVEMGEVGATVKISVGPSLLTAFITREAAEMLGLKKGDVVEAVIKATEVMVAKP
ncbi:MAG: LysR family transcriptional regulator [Candidatus Hadarchaeales archaeon]